MFFPENISILLQFHVLSKLSSVSLHDPPLIIMIMMIIIMYIVRFCSKTFNTCGFSVGFTCPLRFQIEFLTEESCFDIDLMHCWLNFDPFSDILCMSIVQLFLCRFLLVGQQFYCTYCAQPITFLRARANNVMLVGFVSHLNLSPAQFWTNQF